MKPLIVTNHALEQYASRTGRCQFSCVAELINSIRGSNQIEYQYTFDCGFNIARRFKGDTYHVWYDSKIGENLLAIIAKDGAIKTVLRKDMFSYNPNGKIRFERRGNFEYKHESSKRKSRHRVH